MKALLLLSLITFQAHANFNWTNRVPFQYEMSWKLSKLLNKDVFITDKNLVTSCIKEANGVQGEYDYFCNSSLHLLREGVEDNYSIQFNIIQYDHHQEIEILEVR